jgi:hypothetical protein
VHPATGRRIECEAPLPADFLAAGVTSGMIPK